MAAATLADQLDAGTTALEAAGLPSARVDAEWLLAGLLGVGRVAVRLGLGHAAPAPLAERYADAVSRRARREPLQRILGWEEFRGVRVAKVKWSGTNALEFVGVESARDGLVVRAKSGNFIRFGIPPAIDRPTDDDSNHRKYQSCSDP